MKNLRETIATNIVTLRKEQGLTQIGLAKKINYSDKAISRWEKGEVLPDVEILDNLAKVFNVPLSYLLEEHTSTEQKPNTITKNEIAFQILIVLAAWTIATILFAFAEIYFDKVIWQIFVWAVPASSAIVSFFNRKRKNKLLSLICNTIFCWSLITCFYLQFLEFNAWIVYIIGIPIQAAIIVSFVTKVNFRDWR